MTKKSGFTLVEIMIVVAIIGLLAAVGIPSILGAMTRSQTKAMERNVQDVLRAKGMTTLPTDMGGSDYTGATSEANVTTALWTHLDGVGSLADLKVGSHSMTVGTIGKLPTYD